MNAEILCVGTELLLGDIVNTNAAYIAGDCCPGHQCLRHTVVGTIPRLKNSLEEAFARADLFSPQVDWAPPMTI
jgi:nicotinamide-nucleotide amidase